MKSASKIDETKFVWCVVVNTGHDPAVWEVSNPEDITPCCAVDRDPQRYRSLILWRFCYQVKTQNFHIVLEINIQDISQRQRT
jgi:hypothetical protein